MQDIDHWQPLLDTAMLQQDEVAPTVMADHNYMVQPTTLVVLGAYGLAKHE